MHMHTHTDTHTHREWKMLIRYLCAGLFERWWRGTRQQQCEVTMRKAYCESCGPWMTKKTTACQTGLCTTDSLSLVKIADGQCFFCFRIVGSFMASVCVCACMAWNREGETVALCVCINVYSCVCKTKSHASFYSSLCMLWALCVCVWYW